MNITCMASRVALAAGLLLLTINLAFSSEVTTVWERTYRQAVNDEQRYSIMLKIVELKNKDFAPLISESLDKLFVSKIESPDSSQTRTKISLAKILIQELGNLRSSDDALLIANVYRDVKDPFLKSEAAIALGKMRATDYVGLLVQDLTAINVSPEQANPGPKEVMAFGLVQSLELMHSPEGFEPVFFASIGWYSNIRQVKETARAALKTMIDDPSPQLKAIIIRDANYANKLRALEAIEESNAPAAAKNEIARIGLDQGLSAHETDVMLKAKLAEIRIKSVSILVANKDKSPETVAMYSRILDEKFSFDETLIAYVGLGRNGGPEAVKLLVARMKDYNERQKAKKNTTEDRKLIMQVIQSLKDTKSPDAKPVLVEAQFSDHDGTVARTAREAAETLP